MVAMLVSYRNTGANTSSFENKPMVDEIESKIQCLFKAHLPSGISPYYLTVVTEQ